MAHLTRSATATKPYVVVANAGYADEFVVSEHASYQESVRERARQSAGDFDTDVMKRLPDGSLTTEF